MMKYDLHIHSIASGHSFNTIFELAKEASSRNMEAIAIIEHGPSMEGAPHLGYFEMLHHIPKERDGVRIFSGCEANIINIDGVLDIPVDIQKNIDFVMAGLHGRTPYSEETSKEDNTKAIIAAIKNNRIHIIVHPYRLEFPVDLERVMEVASKNNVLMELNISLLKRHKASSELLKQVKLMIKIAQKKKTKIVISSDAHIATDIGDNSVLKELQLNIPDEIVLGRQGGIKEIEDFINAK